MNLIKEFLQKTKENSLTIHCVGDAMIDEYIDISINRISPEAPIMIMHSEDESSIKRPGGAANVAYQFKHFNTDVTLFCFYDENAARVFSKHNIEYKSAPFSGINCELPVKRRFIHDNSQVARHDIEKPNCALDSDLLDFVTKHVGNVIERSLPADVAILSDYHKGFFLSEEHNVMDFYRDTITIVDPKKGPIDKWHGCTIFKPNAKEAYELSGKKNWKEQAKFFQNKLECESVVITCGGEKVVGVHKNDFFCYKPSKRVEVESVIGAGDCFCAFFSMAVGQGYEAPQAAEIAWNAGSIYVQRKMNRPIVPAELAEDKLVDPADLKSRDFKLSFTNGCFDIVHSGHLSSLKFAKEQGDKLVVAVNSDESIDRLKSTDDDKRPVKPLSERIALLASLEFVDFVVVFEEDDPYEVIKTIMPDLIVKSADYDPEEVVGSDLVSVKIAPMIEGVSSTDFINDWRDRSTN